MPAWVSTLHESDFLPITLTASIHVTALIPRANRNLSKKRAAKSVLPDWESAFFGYS